VVWGNHVSKRCLGTLALYPMESSMLYRRSRNLPRWLGNSKLRCQTYQNLFKQSTLKCSNKQTAINYSRRYQSALTVWGFTNSFSSFIAAFKMLLRWKTLISKSKNPLQPGIKTLCSLVSTPNWTKKSSQSWRGSLTGWASSRKPIGPSVTQGHRLQIRGIPQSISWLIHGTAMKSSKMALGSWRISRHQEIRLEMLNRSLGWTWIHRITPIGLNKSGTETLARRAHSFITRCLTIQGAQLI
jgi:hypothetical protein